jgi:integrase
LNRLYSIYLSVKALGLHWEDIDLENEVATIKRSFSNYRIGATNNGKRRTIVLSNQIVHVLYELSNSEILRYMKIVQRPVVVFAKDGDYSAYHTIRNAWIKMLKKVEMPYMKLHGIRHTVASLMIDAGFQFGRRNILLVIILASSRGVFIRIE